MGFLARLNTRLPNGVVQDSMSFWGPPGGVVKFEVSFFLGGIH